MKLDISKAIGRTFAFLFGHFVDVLRIAWLPILLQLAAFFLLMPGYARGTAGLATISPGDADAAAQAFVRALPAFGLFGLFILASFVTSVPMVVGLTRLVLKGEKPKTPFYLGWGNDETKVLLAWLIFAAIVVALVIVIQYGSILLRGVIGPGPIGAAIVFVINLVLLAAIVTVCVRLSLLAPATVSSGKMSLRDSWERTDDDFWNFLGFWMLYFVVFIIFYLVLYFTFLLPPGYFESFRGITPGDRDSVLDAMRKANEVMVKSYDLSDMDNVVRLGVGAIIGPIGGIITSIAGASAWKLVTDPNQT